jgi:hypothetical protein
MKGIEAHRGAVQVHGFQERGEVAVLVVLDIHLEVIRQPTAVLGDAGEVNRVPSARRVPRQVLPSMATALNRPRAGVYACSAARRAR